MAILSLDSLLGTVSKQAIYEKALEVAEIFGVPVTSWQPGDPTRSLYHVLSEQLYNEELVIAAYVASGFLDFASGDWLTLLAKQVFNVDRTEATQATCSVLMTNNGGALFESLAAGDVTFKNTTTGKTYTNTSGGTLASGPGTTLAVDVQADEAGSDSSAGIGDIDDLVTTLLNVTVANTTVAIGVDEEDDEALRARCRNKLGSLSPNGPADAYDYVALTPSLTGTTNVTRSRTIADSATGDVTQYYAGPSGAVAGADVTLVNAAIQEWALPLCITHTGTSAANVVVAVTYELWIYEAVGETDAAIKTAIESALDDMIASQPIGGDVITTPPGALYKSLIESTIMDTYPDHAFRVTVSVPAGDTSLTINQVATPGVVTGTINQIADP
jgi:uncharacterized phage protein gp47/JayE